MPNLQLTFACESYSHVRALQDGSVRPDGIDLTTLHLFPADTFPRLIRDREFEVSEMGLTFYLATLALPDPPFIAIPVFPSRSFRHSAIYVNRRRGIARPADLSGKRLGETFCYGHDAGLWAKGLLSDEYGVRPESASWVTGGLDRPMPRWDWLPFAPPPGVRVEHVADRGLAALLAAGEIDALFSAHPPAALARGGDLGRLFEDFEPVERAYFARTGIFPIMHTIVIRRDVYRGHPWVAASLYQAFRAAKAAVDDLYAYWETSLHRLLMIPWVTELRRKNRELMGEEPWPYGIARNRRALETAIRYHLEQGLSQQRRAVEELFAPETYED